VRAARHVAFAACLLSAAVAAAACELVLSEHRGGAELTRLPLDAAAPQVRIAFEHSVLGTTVIDRYRFAPQAHLVEERFDGQGYGLAHAAGPGETLIRDEAGWRLMLDRLVDPLVVRPLPLQHMRLLLAGREWLLGGFSAQAIELQARGCAGS
jgi:hypothetical protein